jgi:DNA-binding transcriptional MerR regulator/quercetin dioxygenase-like cupin family protein
MNAKGSSARGASGNSRKSSRIGFLTVGQTARILGVSASTLRLWENVGLISPARSAGKYRLYNSELLEVLKRIKYLRDVKKLSVPGIKQELGKNLGRQPAAAGTPEGNGDGDIGSKLRRMRQRLSLGIVEAATRAKISPGFLSAIELSKANPSVATLQRLAATYNTTVLEFFDMPRHARRLVRPDQRRVLKTESGVSIELLSIGTKMLECMIFRVAPKSGSDGSYSHAGEEFIYMLSGQLEIWLDEWECHTLEPGDSFWFESNLGHRWFNPSNEEAVLIWVNTPLTF